MSKDGNARIRYKLPSALPLTRRHIDILKCAAQGMGWIETADALGIAPQTVKNHRASLFERLKVRNITHAVYLVTKQGLIE